jgi:hypothetical protein
MKKMTLLAINEFNADFFHNACENFDLPNIKRMLAQHHSNTWTDEEIERGGLDPWVQWVSIHTGVSFNQHGILHLGDISNLSYDQLWEKLSEKNISSGVWGAMNASRGKANHCLFFLPDPWTFSERAYPEDLNKLLDFPRYYARNYLDKNIVQTVKHLISLMAFIFTKPVLMLKLLTVLPITINSLLKFGLKSYVLFSLFDLVSTYTFLHYKKKYNPEFSLLFLNSVAHAQHNIWCKDGTLDDKNRFTLKIIDKILGLLEERSDVGEEIIVMNALTQRNLVGIKTDVLYRQINPSKFLDGLGIRYKSVEQLMTNDGHIIFNNAVDCLRAKELLTGATIDQEVIFDVDHSLCTPLKLFYQLEYWQELPSSSTFKIDNKDYAFFEFFEKVVVRTGEHLQRGDVYSTDLRLPERLYNHDIHNYILDFFDQKNTN